MDTTTTTSPNALPPPATSSTPTPPPPGSPSPALPAPGPSARRSMSAGHIVALIVGCLLLLPGLGMAAGGGFALLGQEVATDEDGYFSVALDRLESDGVAVTANDITLDADWDEDGDWLLDWLDVDVRLRVDGVRTSDDVFIGIARTADVDRYLDDVSYSEIVEIDERTPRYRTVDGATSVASPLDQDIWTHSASGTGEQELVWEARQGQWSVVVMNADGSPNVTAETEVAAKTGALTPIAITLLVIGGLVTIAAVSLIVVGARGRRERYTPDPGTPAAEPLTD